jgi:hypothetical protein
LKIGRLEIEFCENTVTTTLKGNLLTIFQSLSKDYDKVGELGTPIIAAESREEFKKLVKCIDKRTNTLKVKYSSRKCGIGRRYADCPVNTLPNGLPNPQHGKFYSALIAMPRLKKNTIFEFQRL